MLLASLAAEILSLLESLHSLRGGLQYLRLFQRSEGRAPAKRGPPVTLILPCKGIDKGLKENLFAYFELDYPDRQILLVTGDSHDPAVAVLKEVSSLYPDVTLQILFSGETRKRSQKVHNLLHALDYLREDDEILAFGKQSFSPRRSTAWSCGKDL